MSRSHIIAGLLVFIYSGLVQAIPVTVTDTSLFTATDVVDSESGLSDLDAYGRGDVNYLSTNYAELLASDFDYVTWTHHFDSSLGSILSGEMRLTLRDNTDQYAEFGFVYGEDGTFGIGEVDTRTYGFDLDSSFLADGTFTVTLASILGDFYIDNSQLIITYDDNHAVPEPSTLTLLGGVLLFIGLAHYSSRRNKFGTGVDVSGKAFG